MEVLISKDKDFVKIVGEVFDRNYAAAINNPQIKDLIERNIIAKDDPQILLAVMGKACGFSF